MSSYPTDPPPLPTWTIGYQEPRPPRRGLTIAFAIVTGVVVVGCTVLTQGLTWFVDEVLTVSPGYDLPDFAWALAGWVGSILAFVGALCLALVPRLEWARDLGRYWLAAVLLGAALGTARIVPPD